MSDLAPALAGRTIAVLGGTGPQGRGLARRFAAAGIPVVLGSRSAERAAEVAAGPPGTVSCRFNADAAAEGGCGVGTVTPGSFPPERAPARASAVQRVGPRPSDRSVPGDAECR